MDVSSNATKRDDTLREMNEREPNTIDGEDLSELLEKVENSFDIKFDDTELANVGTFGQLCDHIANKIQLANIDDCTTQQAFYKLRKSFSSELKC